jgi:predicted dehydrogenase
MGKVRWGILSTASIARVMVSAARRATRAEFVAVASRDGQKGRRFADEEGLRLSFGTYDELLASDEVDAVYVALPVSLHTEWTIRALQAGKHVLCEKPFALTAGDAARCFDAAEAAGLQCIEGLMYRHHPQTALARRLVAEGAIGTLAYVRAALSVTVPPGDIRRTGHLGGGAVIDLGSYCISAVRLFAGEPAQVYAEQVVDGAEEADGSDLRLACTMRAGNDVLAQFDVSLDYPRRDELELIGTAGKVTVRDPWLCRAGYLELESDGNTERMAVGPLGELAPSPDEDDVYRMEIEAASAAIVDGTSGPFGRQDAINQAAVVEGVRRSANEGRPVQLV